MPENCADENPTDDDAQWLFAGDPQTHVASLTERFTEVFGRSAQGVWFAPGRANLNGEHIDFHGGRCLPMALRHGTYAAAAPRTDGLLRLRTLEPTLDAGVVEISPTDVVGTCARGDQESGGTGWTRYVSGVVWAMQQLNHTEPELTLPQSFGADVLIRSTLPIGAGLSSSASLECVAALAFTALGTPLGRANPGEALNDDHRAVLAQACIRAEVEVVGAGTGGLDQTTSLRAAEGTLLSLDCRDFSLVGTDVSSLLDKHRFIAVDTGEPHALATGEFACRRAESEAAAAVLGVGRLRDALGEKPQQADVEQALHKYDGAAPNDDVTHPALKGFDPAACRRRLVHALTEMLRSEQLHILLTSQHHHHERTARRIGDIMSAGHTSMRENAQVSFPMADQVVETVLANGALGARLIGGGFGGSVLVLLPTADTERITTAAAELLPNIRFLAVDPSAAAQMV